MKNKKLIAIVALLLVACLCLAFAACKDDPEVTKLDAPQITLDSATGTVSWKKVEHADSYDVMVNNNAAINVTATSYVFPDSTAEGSYDVTVIAKSSDTKLYSASDASNKVTFVKEVIHVQKTLTQLTMTAEPTKSVYFLDEKATEAEFAGAAFLAKYDDGTSKVLSITDLDVDDYTMQEGDVDVTVSYTENNVTKKFTVTFTVRERTDDDIDVNGVQIIANSVDEDKYVVANTEATKVVNMRGDDLALNAAEGKTTVAKSALKLGRNLLAVTDGEGTELVLVVVGTLISTPAEFKAMAADVANSAGKYYVITRDLDFENGWQDPIGAAPIAVSHLIDTENIYTPDPVNGAEGDGNGAPKNEDGEPMEPVKNQNGVAFLGTLDGLGHTIMNYKIGKATWQPSGYGVAMFGWLGGGAVISNLNLRNVNIAGGAFTSVLVGVNSGTIENVSIEESCAVSVSYHHGAAIVAYNFGKIENVTCLADKYTKGSVQSPMVLAYTATGDEDTTVKNGFIGNGNHSVKLGGGWRYFDGIGTLYVTPSYVRINSTDNILAIGSDELVLDVIIQENDPANVEVNFFGGFDSEHKYADALSYEWKSGKLYIKIKNPASTQFVGGETVNMAISGSGTTATFTISITAAYVTGYDLLDGENNVVSELPINITEGLDIELGNINIRKNMSDGETSIVHPSRLEGFDKNGPVGVLQTVKAFYGTGDNDFVTLKVTLLAKQVTGIEMSAQPDKNVYTIGTDTVLDLTGAKILVSYNNGTNDTMDVLTDMLDPATYNLEVAAAYNVKVSFGGYDCTFGITVRDAAITVTGISIVGTPAKDTYKFNSSVVAATDLAGATVTATLSAGDPTTGIVITDAMIKYNFNALGKSNITVTYEEKTATIEVTVVDYATALIAKPKTGLDLVDGVPQLAYSKVTPLNLLDAADYVLTMASGATAEADISKITASEAESGRHEITYTYTDDYAKVTVTQIYDIWYELAQGDETAAQAWALMQSKLSGYYKLVADLDFKHGETDALTPLGQQGYATNGDGSTYDPNEVGKGNYVQNLTVATPFTGKFDGQGYSLTRFNCGFDSWTANGFGVSPFGHIGQGGSVENVIIRQATFKAKRFAFIAGVNEGTIRNIMIEATCSATQTFGSENFHAVLINTTTGVMDNIVSYVTTGNNTSGAEGKTTMPVIAYQYNRANENAITDFYVVDVSAAYDETQWTGLEGWTMLNNYGPVYGHYVVVIPETTVEEGGKVTVRIYHGENTLYTFDYVHVWSGINNGVEPKKESEDVWTINLSHANLSGMTAGNSYSCGLRVDGKYIMFTLSVVAPESL